MQDHAARRRVITGVLAQRAVCAGTNLIRPRQRPPPDFSLPKADGQPRFGAREKWQGSGEFLKSQSKNAALALGDFRKMECRIGPDFGSYSRRGNRNLVDYVTVGATQKTDEKTTKMVFHWTEIALLPALKHSCAQGLAGYLGILPHTGTLNFSKVLSMGPYMDSPALQSNLIVIETRRIDCGHISGLLTEACAS